MNAADVPAVGAGVAAGRRRRDLPRRLALHLLLALFSLFVLVPIWFAFLGSFKELPDFYRDQVGLPEVWHWENYVAVWQEAHIVEYALNSVIVTGIALPIQVTLATLAAYGIARYRTRRATFFYLFFLAGLVIPGQLTLLPTVLLIKSFGLLNTYGGLIVPYIAFGQPFAVFLIVGFLRTLPSELEDAGRIDGANEVQILLQIMVPLVRPAIASVLIFNGVGMWNDFLFPYIVSTKLPTIQVGILQLHGSYGTAWGLIFAGVMIAALPIIVLYVLLTKQFISGLAAGAIKG